MNLSHIGECGQGAQFPQHSSLTKLLAISQLPCSMTLSFPPCRKLQATAGATVGRGRAYNIDTAGRLWLRGVGGASGAPRAAGVAAGAGCVP